MITEWMTLFSEVTDTPGRLEYLEVQVRYLGSSRWQLRQRVKDLEGHYIGDDPISRMGSKKLITWLMQVESEANEEYQFSENNDNRAASVTHIANLKKIAEQVGAAHCLATIEKLEQGQWPESRRPPTIISITGVTKRAVWRGVYHIVYRATTSKGDAFLYFLDENGVSKLVLVISTTTDNEFEVKLSGRILRQLERYRPEHQEKLEVHENR